MMDWPRGRTLILVAPLTDFSKELDMVTRSAARKGAGRAAGEKKATVRRHFCRVRTMGSPDSRCCVRRAGQPSEAGMVGSRLGMDSLAGTRALTGRGWGDAAGDMHDCWPRSSAACAPFYSADGPVPTVFPSAVSRERQRKEVGLFSSSCSIGTKCCNRPPLKLRSRLLGSNPDASWHAGGRPTQNKPPSGMKVADRLAKKFTTARGKRHCCLCRSGRHEPRDPGAYSCTFG